MKKCCSFWIILVLSCLWQVKAQDSSWCHFYPKAPRPGDKLHISYHPPKEAGEKPLTGIIYVFDTGYQWRAADLTLQPAGDSFTTTYQLPADAALACCKFKRSNGEDRGGRFPYAVMTSFPGNKPVPGAYYAWGIIRAPYMQHQPLPPVADSAAYIQPEVVRYWIRNEMRNYPDKRLAFIVPSFTAFRLTDTSVAATSTLYSELQKVLETPGLTEKNRMDVAIIYRNVLKDRNAADSIDNSTIQQFPGGIVARDRKLFSIFREADLSKKISEIEQLLQDFPPARFTDVRTETTNLYYGKLFQTLVYTPIVKDSNYANFFHYLPVVPNYMLPIFYHHLVEIPYQQQQVAPTTLLRLSDSLINRILTYQPEGILSPSKKQKAFIHINTTPFFTHARLLKDAGQPAKALAYAEKIKEGLDCKDAAFNDLYIQLLVANSRQAAIPAYLKSSIARNAATPAMLDRFEADYRKQHGSLTGYAAYLNAAKGGTVQTQQQELRKELVDQPIYPFRLQNARGAYVDLKQLKGKVVVLDFWATWCAPCKAAMPGMQLAVEKYKQDTSVAFYFIATLETKPDYKQLIQHFMVEKKYPFEVLYDGYNPDTKHPDAIYSRYSADFKFSGIPQKMIIDANGRLRWRSTGFAGSPSALADEISTIIELVKKS